MPFEAKEKQLQSYCSEHFHFLALMRLPVLMRFDMTFDGPLRDGSSFGNVNSQIFTFTGVV